MSLSTIRSIDLSLSAQPVILNLIDAACRDLGFFVLSGHGVSPALVDETYSVGLTFFDLPLQEKLAVARPGEDVSRGYNRLADQSHAATFGEKPVPDLQESFGIGPLDPRPVPIAPEGATAFAPNLWPNRPASFKTTLEQYYREMERLARRLVKLFAAALEMPPRHFDRHFDSAASVLRLVHYPAQSTPPLTGQMRAGPHTDFGVLTILRIDDAAGGLQVRDRAGNWLDISAPPGSFIVNIGDLMQRWTSDRWTSSVHRVVNPPRAIASLSRRLSIVFFHEPDPDAIVQALSDDRGVPAYPDVVAAAYRQSRVRVLRGAGGKQ